MIDYLEFIVEMTSHIKIPLSFWHFLYSYFTHFPILDWGLLKT